MGGRSCFLYPRVQNTSTPGPTRDEGSRTRYHHQDPLQVLWLSCLTSLSILPALCLLSVSRHHPPSQHSSLPPPSSLFSPPSSLLRLTGLHGSAAHDFLPCRFRRVCPRTTFCDKGSIQFALTLTLICKWQVRQVMKSLIEQRFQLPPKPPQPTHTHTPKLTLFSSSFCISSSISPAHTLSPNKTSWSLDMLHNYLWFIFNFFFHVSKWINYGVSCKRMQSVYVQIQSMEPDTVGKKNHKKVV